MRCGRFQTGFIQLLACSALVIAFSGGAFGADDRDSSLLPLRFVTVADQGSIRQDALFGDLDGDGSDECIEWTSSHVTASRLRGPDDALVRSNLIDHWPGPGGSIRAGLVNVHGSTSRLVYVARPGGRQSLCEVASVGPGDQVTWVALPPYDAINWQERGGGLLDISALLPCALVGGREGPVLLARVATGYFPKARAVTAYSWPSGRLLWHREMGPIPVRLTIGALPAMGGSPSVRAVFVGTYAPGNGHSAEGTADSVASVLGYALDQGGADLWPPMHFAGLHSSSVAAIGPTDPVGEAPLLVATNNSAHPSSIPGRLELVDARTGRRLRSSPWNADIHEAMWTSDLEGNAGPGLNPRAAILATTIDGRALLIDRSLSILASRKLGTSACTFSGMIDLGDSRGGTSRRGLVFMNASGMTIVDGRLRMLAWEPLLSPEEFLGVVRRDGRPRLVALRRNGNLHLLSVRSRPLAEIASARIRRLLHGPAALIPLLSVALLAAITLQLAALRRRDLTRRDIPETQAQERRLSSLLTRDSIGVAISVHGRPAADREGLLAEACGSNARFRSRVEQALRVLDSIGERVDADETPSVPAPSTIGRYSVTDILGRGGMSTVYLGEDPVLNRRVGIKLLQRPLQGDQADEGMRKEAELIARITHRNLPVVYAFESGTRSPYIVMEYIPGIDLRRRLLGGPLSVEGTVLVCLQVARALEAAHAAGIVHLDLKPSNVMVTPEGTVKILDLGLSRLVVDDDSPPIDGVFSGTLGYISPEQMEGAMTDHRTDLWGFGCLAFECVSGRPAFAPDWGLDGRYPDPDWGCLPLETPPLLRRLIRSCLSNAPEGRPASMGEISECLLGILQSIFVLIPLTSAVWNASRATLSGLRPRHRSGR